MNRYRLQMSDDSGRSSDLIYDSTDDQQAWMWASTIAACWIEAGPWSGPRPGGYSVQVTYAVTDTNAPERPVDNCLSRTEQIGLVKRKVG